MCGISGLLLAPDADPRRLDDVGGMLARLVHRGPDSEGIWTDPPAGVALGHRRLAIVDLSPAGHQPMVAHGGRLVMTYNGEIYDAPDLARGLTARGHRFAGHSDTEAMLTAFESDGVAATLPRLAGMFAFGVWDRRERVLHLARDRLGKKPLYIARAGGGLAFASELKALRALRDFRPVLDPVAFAAFLRQGWVPDDHCIWRDVVKLRPGTLLSLRAGDAASADVASLRARMRPYWSLDDVVTEGQSRAAVPDPEEAVEELEAVLRRAVRERMMADVPLGALLSGGVDSAVVVALMQAQAARPVRTYTVGFGESRYDESTAAAAVARHLGTEHTALRLTPAMALAAIPELPLVWDEPFADESQIPTLLVSRLARAHVTVALTGDGGDEAFGGYARHLAAARIDRLRRLPLSLRRGAAAVLRAVGADLWDGALRPVFGGSARAERMVAVLGAADDADAYARLLASGAAACARDPRPPRQAPSGPVLPDPAARMMHRDMAAYLPGDILVKLDRASMAVSLEARCPLLDHRVIEYAWRLPTALKLRDGRGKWVLRQVLRRYVPPHLTERPKHGFDVPVGAWLRHELRAWAGDLLSPARTARAGLLDPGRVQACWREHLSGRRDRTAALWTLLMFQSWQDASVAPAAAVAPAAPPPPAVIASAW